MRVLYGCRVTPDTWWYCRRHGPLAKHMVYRDRDDVFRCQTPDDGDPDLAHLVCGRIAFARGEARTAELTRPTGTFYG